MRPIKYPHYLTSRHPTPHPHPKLNIMLATSATIKWPFPHNSSKHGTKSSVKSGTTSSGIPKYKVQQTRLLHLPKGRKVSRKVICDAIEEIRDVFSSAGAKMISYVPTEEYQFEASKAIRDGKFLGLPLDANNEDDLTGVRHCLQMDTQTGRIWTRTSTSSYDHQIDASSACARALNEAGTRSMMSSLRNSSNLGPLGSSLKG